MKPGRALALKDLQRRLPVSATIQGDFVRGFVATGLLSAIQDQRSQSPLNRRALRRALQGGASLAAGSLAAQNWAQRDFGGTLVAVVAGAASVMVIEKLLQDQISKESHDGQEKA